MRFFILFSLLTLTLACKGGQQPTPTTQATLGDTVSVLGSNIMSIYQDSRQHYWFGSWDAGLYHYDGTTLVQYTTQHGLANNRIDEIKEDADGNLYFSSCHPTASVCRYDGKSFITLNAKPTNDWQLHPTDLWFRHAFRQEKVLRYDGTTLHELQLPKPPELPNPFEVYSIYQDSRKNIWFGTNPVGVCRYDGDTFQWITEEDVTEFRNEGANGVRSITEDANGDFWFNTEYRYQVYDSTTLKSDRFYTRLVSIGGLDGKANSALDEYLSIVKDKEDKLWMVTYVDGVWSYDGHTITHHPIQENQNNISTFCIYKDRQDALWVGTHENGVYRFNGTAFERFTPNAM